MIKISNISLARGNNLILKRVSLTVNTSEIILIKGPNGRGKSTFLSCIANFIEPMEGTIYYQDKLVDEQISSKNFIFISEENFAYENISIIENIYYWLALNGVKPNNNSINKCLTYLYGHLDVEKKFLSLSFGQKRKMRMLLLMLIQKPVWLLDDPFNGLDEVSINKLSRLIFTKRDQGGIVIIATHIIPEITAMREFNL